MGKNYELLKSHAWLGARLNYCLVFVTIASNALHTSLLTFPP